jgi:hypothetical protein
MSQIGRSAATRNQDTSRNKNAITNASFALTGSSLGIANLIINAYGLALTAFVSIGLFVMTLGAIANYAVNANHNKKVHRVIVSVEAAAAFAVMLEVLLHPTAKTLAFDFVVFLAFLFFEVFLGVDVWRYLHTESGRK